MVKVIIHRDSNGKSPYEDYLKSVATSQKREAQRIRVYVQRLSQMGSFEMVKMNWAEKLDSMIWELKPQPHRILYFWDDAQRCYVLLNGFRKKTRRTPPTEIRKAEVLRAQYLAKRWLK